MKHGYVSNDMVCKCGHSDCVHHFGDQCSLCLEETNGKDGCYNYQEKELTPLSNSMYLVCTCGESYVTEGDAEFGGRCRRCRNEGKFRLEVVEGTIKPWVFKQYKTHEEYMTNKG